MTQEIEPLVAFLKPFTEGAEGYLGVTRVTRSQDPKENKRWGSFSNLYPEVTNGTADLTNAVPEGSQNWEWYFTPAVLSEPNRTQVKFKQSNVIWIDFDEPVDWENMNPAPSIVVQTSQEKFHCYWLMDEPITDVHSMRYWCSRFLNHFGGDLSGFDATQLLKLPYGRNLKLGAKQKDGTPFAPKVVKFDQALRYNEGSFASMPEPVMDTIKLVDLSDIPDIPEIDGDWKDYFDKYEKDLTPGLYRRLDRVKDDGEKRSGELYSLTCELLARLKDPEKVFQILCGSPNDKFTKDHGISKGAQLLWKDINRVEAKKKQEQEEKQGTVEKKSMGDVSVTRFLVDEIMTRPRISTREKGVEVAAIVLNELDENGLFVWSTEGDTKYYDLRVPEKPLIYDVSVDKTTEFSGFVCREYGINAGVDAAVLSGILHAALQKCQTQTKTDLRDFAYYDQSNNTVYVDRYDGTMYVLDGDTVEHEPHGFNGVYFKTTSDAFPMPYSYTPDYTPGTLDELVFKKKNYTTEGANVESKHIEHILKTWVATFFFQQAMKTKPLVIIYGDPNSGKTTLFNNLSALMTGDHEEAVGTMPKDTKDFDVLVSRNPYTFLDNVNVHVKEMQERLAQVATGFVTKSRKLHTNSEVSRLKARAFLGMTTFTIDKLQQDVAQRSIVIPVHPFSEDPDHKSQSLTAIVDRVTSRRDTLWSELLDFVNSIVQEIGHRGGIGQAETKFRMGDYAAFLSITSDLCGLDYNVMERFIQFKQNEIHAANEILYTALREYVSSVALAPAPVTPTALYKDLVALNRRFKGKYETTRKFSTALKHAMRDNSLEDAGIGVEEKKYSKAVKYKITNLRPDEDMEDED